MNGVKAEFKYEDLLSTVFGNEEAEDVCGRDEFKGGIIAALRNGDEGEITVLIPEESIAVGLCKGWETPLIPRGSRIPSRLLLWSAKFWIVIMSIMFPRKNIPRSCA